MKLNIYGIDENSDLGQLITEIEETAAARGQTLSRWKYNKSRFSTVITYAVHHGPRAERSDRQPFIQHIVTLSRHETPSKRGGAYRKLSELLEAMTK